MPGEREIGDTESLTLFFQGTPTQESERERGKSGRREIFESDDDANYSNFGGVLASTRSKVIRNRNSLSESRPGT